MYSKKEFLVIGICVIIMNVSVMLWQLLKWYFEGDHIEVLLLVGGFFSILIAVLIISFLTKYRSIREPKDSSKPTS